ncbi:MAG: hypothetical protein WC438_05950 [Candidatus Pacearchaeota archaeon]
MNIGIDDVQIEYWIHLRDNKKEDTEEEYTRFLKNKLIEIYEKGKECDKEHDKRIKKYDEQIEKLKNDVDRTFGCGFSDMILRKYL